jgi:hypothetical protein
MRLARRYGKAICSFVLPLYTHIVAERRFPHRHADPCGFQAVVTTSTCRKRVPYKRIALVRWSPRPQAFPKHKLCVNTVLVTIRQLYAFRACPKSL